MKKTLGFYQFIRNATKYDYPFEESLLSVLPVADQLVVCECMSEDDTFDRLAKFVSEHGDKNIKIIRHDWIDNHLGLSKLGNFAADELTTDWIWQIQGDEVLHESSYEFIKQVLQKEFPTETCYLVNYFHFLANYETEFDFCYRSIKRLARNHTGWQLVGDACELAGGNLETVRESPIMVYHYGKVHQGNIGWEKEVNFQELFKSIGFPDPKMKEMEEKLGEKFCDYLYLFESSIKEGKVRRFEGTHPAVMQDRIKAFKEGGYEQFVSRLDHEITLKTTSDL